MDLNDDYEVMMPETLSGHYELTSWLESTYDDQLGRIKPKYPQFLGSREDLSKLIVETMAKTFGPDLEKLSIAFKNDHELGKLMIFKVCKVLAEEVYPYLQPTFSVSGSFQEKFPYPFGIFIDMLEIYKNKERFDFVQSEDSPEREIYEDLVDGSEC